MLELQKSVRMIGRLVSYPDRDYRLYYGHKLSKINRDVIDNPYQDEELFEMMDKLHQAYPGQTELLLRGQGFRMTDPPISKALELAGLSGYEAARQQATGKVVF